MWRWEDVKTRRFEDEKMIYRPPLLKEPFAQTLSGNIWRYDSSEEEILNTYWENLGFGEFYSIFSVSKQLNGIMALSNSTTPTDYGRTLRCTWRPLWISSVQLSIGNRHQSHWCFPHQGPSRLIYVGLGSRCVWRSGRIAMTNISHHFMAILWYVPWEMMGNIL